MASKAAEGFHNLMGTDSFCYMRLKAFIEKRLVFPIKCHEVVQKYFLFACKSLENEVIKSRKALICHQIIRGERVSFA